MDTCTFQLAQRLKKCISPQLFQGIWLKVFKILILYWKVMDYIQISIVDSWEWFYYSMKTFCFDFITAVLLKWRCYSWWSFCELKFSYSKARRDNPPPVLKNLKIKISLKTVASLEGCNGCYSTRQFFVII